MLQQAKEELKKLIIADMGEDAYNREVQKRVKLIGEIKESGDLIFGRNNKLFRKDVIKTVMETYDNYDEESLLYETVMMEIALDVFMESA